MRFFKYRAVTSNDFDSDYAIRSLIESKAKFSGRKEFNDLFDSKIYLLRPTVESIEALIDNPKLVGDKDLLKTWISKGNFTPSGISSINNLELTFNQLIDTYPIYCVSTKNNCDLLWAHYTDCHRGFCIEFEFPDSQPKKVKYQKHIPTLFLLDFIQVPIFGDKGKELGDNVLNALHAKKDCWASEKEYRWILGDGKKIPSGESFILKPYSPDSVKAIIFGCRASSDLKDYIKSNLPYTTEFKQAVEGRDQIEILPCK